MFAGPWTQVRDGNPTVRAIFDRHYSRRADAPQTGRFVGPGEYMALVTPAADAIFIWRRERYRLDAQTGVNCAVFRREDGALRASDLIRSAQEEAWARWPRERLFTFVDAAKVESSNPGYCFKMAGWRFAGRSAGGLDILEMLPEWAT